MATKQPQPRKITVDVIKTGMTPLVLSLHKLEPEYSQLTPEMCKILLFIVLYHTKVEMVWLEADRIGLTDEDFAESIAALTALEIIRHNENVWYWINITKILPIFEVQPKWSLAKLPRVRKKS